LPHGACAATPSRGGQGGERAFKRFGHRLRQCHFEPPLAAWVCVAAEPRADFFAWQRRGRMPQLLDFCIHMRRSFSANGIRVRDLRRVAVFENFRHFDATGIFGRFVFQF
jgi:hypothetical protein